MIDMDSLRLAVVKGLKDYTGSTVLQGNQIMPQPGYPFISYTVITPASANKGSWQKHEDGIDRKLIKQTWSISALSNKSGESLGLALQAREWLEHSGRLYLKDKGFTVQSVGQITNRDNILSGEYEYRNGFDVVFYLYETSPAAEGEFINTAQIKEKQED